MIYLNLNSKPTSFREVLDALYNDQQEITTICPTYSDEDCIQMECSAGRRRSFQALFEIARTYFPDISIIEFYNCLHEKQLYYWVCEDIDRVVFMTKGGYSTRSTIEKFLFVLEDEYEGYSDNMRVIEELKTFIQENN